MSVIRSAALACAVLALLVAPVNADHGTWHGDATPATVSGHGSSFAGRVHPETWGPDCSAVYPVKADGHVLDESYGYVAVVHETITGPFAITLFREPMAGTFVWPDTDGNGAYDNDYRTETGAKAIILCATAPDVVIPQTDTVEPGRSPDLPALPFVLIFLASAFAASFHARRRPQPSR